MCEVTPYMVSVATKRGISVIYHSFPWYISYKPQRGAFDLNHRCGIYIYHDHVKLQRHHWLHIGHIHPNPQVSIYIYLPEVSIYILTQVSIYILTQVSIYILTWDVT